MTSKHFKGNSSFYDVEEINGNVDDAHSLAADQRHGGDWDEPPALAHTEYRAPRTHDDGAYHHRHPLGTIPHELFKLGKSRRHFIVRQAADIFVLEISHKEVFRGLENACIAFLENLPVQAS